MKHKADRSVCWLLSQRPVPLAEIKVSPPKFDLAATNFPPLPGCVVSTQGEPVLENRMSDVVRGLYRDKVRRNSDCKKCGCNDTHNDHKTVKNLYKSLKI